MKAIPDNKIPTLPFRLKSVKKIERFGLCILYQIKLEVSGTTLTRQVPSWQMEENSYLCIKTYFPETNMRLSNNRIQSFNNYFLLKLKECETKQFNIGLEERSSLIKKKKAYAKYYSLNKNHKIETTYVNGILLEQFLDCIYNEEAIPLIAFLFHALLSTLIENEFFRYPNFIVSLTCEDIFIAKKLALTICNVYERIESFYTAAYSDIHITKEDDAGTIIKKAYRCKDGILIAFEPTKEQMLLLQELYVFSDCAIDKIRIINNEKPIFPDTIFLHPGGCCLIVAKNIDSIPFETLNIPIKNHYTEELINLINEFPKNIISEELECFMNSIASSYSKKTKIYQKQYSNWTEQLQPIFTNDYQLNAYCSLLSAFDLYIDYLNSSKFTTTYENTELFQRYITDLKFEKSDIEEREQAEFICHKFDLYFENARPERVARAGGIVDVNYFKIWYDKIYIYVIAETLNEILQMSEITLTNDAKKLLAKFDYIAHIFGEQRNEYSIKLSKPPCEYANKNTRYIAFSRNICGSRRLLPNIESLINRIEESNPEYRNYYYLFPEENDTEEKSKQNNLKLINIKHQKTNNTVAQRCKQLYLSK